MDVDQQEAFRRSGRFLGWVAIPPLMVPILWATSSRRFTIGSALAALLIVVAVLGFVSWMFRRQRRAWLESHWGPLELRIPGAAAAHVDAARKHLARWWAVHLNDRRGWPSLYAIPARPAPRVLWLECQEEGDELVLRGSADHVRAAAAFLQKRVRSAQANPARGLAS